MIKIQTDRRDAGEVQGTLIVFLGGTGFYMGWEWEQHGIRDGIAV